MNNNEIEIAAPAAKLVTVWGLVGFSSLADAASAATLMAAMLAGLYSFLLISEWFWKRMWRPLFEHLGWIKPTARRVITVEEYAAYVQERDE